MAYSTENDLKELEAMASNLTPYLYEDELYGQISSDLPRLTVGGLLLRLNRLLAIEDHLSDGQRQRLHTAKTKFEQMRNEWQNAYEGKIRQELKARIRNLNAYLDEVGSSGQRAEAGYPVEATRRTIVEYLKDEAERRNIWEREIEDEYLKMNNRLRRILNKESGFIWSGMLEPAFPPDKYWWLYRKPGDV